MQPIPQKQALATTGRAIDFLASRNDNGSLPLSFPVPVFQWGPGVSGLAQSCYQAGSRHSIVIVNNVTDMKGSSAMKKLVAMCFVLMFVLSVAGCPGKSGGEAAPKGGNSSEAVVDFGGEADSTTIVSSDEAVEDIEL